MKKKRLDLKILQKEVAEKFAITPCAVGRWESNRARPSIRNIPKIIQFLGYVPFEISGRQLGNKIVVMRQLLGLSQNGLACYLGISRTAISAWEKGNRRPNKELLEKLNTFLISCPLTDERNWQ